MAKTRTPTTPTRRKKAEPAPKSGARTRAKAPRATKPKAGAQAKAPAVPERPDFARDTAMQLAHLSLEKKAQDVLVLDVRGLTSYADYFVLMTAESEPQMSAIADFLAEKMKEKGERPLGVEGTQAGQWVLIDFGDVVVHVFYQDTRQFYDLENLWADAPRFPVHD